MVTTQWRDLAGESSGADVDARTRELSEVVERAELVGALRREEDSSEIDFLVLPRAQTADLFGDAAPDLDSIQTVLARWGEVTRRADGALICTRLRHGGQDYVNESRITVHIAASDSQWGTLLARHTGPAVFFARLVSALGGQGYSVLADGSLKARSGALVAVPDEETLFVRAGLAPLVPRDRVTATPARERSEIPVAVSRNFSEHQGRGMPIERD